MNNFSVFILSLVLVMELFHGYTVIDGRGTEKRREIVRVRAENAMGLKRLTDEYEAKIYEKSGRTVFDRAYNRPDQSIKDMIHNLALEAIPEAWDAEVRVEEFSHFILLLYQPQSTKVAGVEDIKKIIEPVIKQAHPYLKNVAVFNYKRQSYLYFDPASLEYIRVDKPLPNVVIQKIWEQGKTFQSFNAVPIKYESIHGHMVIPVKIGGLDGATEENMLFDTGASNTVIPVEAALRTQNEDLNKVEWQSFNTANGVMKSPVTHRKLIIGGIEKDLRVAVFPKEGEMGLLGVDFLRDMRYVVDSESSTIYVWEKR